ncbi:TIGR03089 family protein [Sinomonas sp. ASV322]|uniref:TIGR03089 family protein n=1 Tax=Sinomonas sp. ASV322 TaxID=3041920 RepID=UPI0027DCA8F7|nr:TIGR03089 family protein [Sinomonas sp. ASV322]MDQ4503692.1 TIGR03089 family protein [Sinomonas sp. ASV322]
MESTAPATVSALLHRLRSGNSSAPRLTWYGPGGERVELSGRVLDNWAAKTSNLLVEELDAELGTTFRIEVPAHWKSAVIALAAWQTGGVLVDGDADIVFSAVSSVGPGADPSAETAAARVAVALGALELSFPGELAPGDLDYAALVRQFADSFDPFDLPSADDGAARLDDVHFTQAELLGRFATPFQPGARVLVDASRPLREVLASLLGAWAADGSAVLRHPDVPDTPRLRETERITAG